MAEYDNAGFPLSYCLLSTATSMEIGKRTKALTAWATCVRDKYGIEPEFAHVDKDMAEIAMLRRVWRGIKIQICWWHLRKAVRERLAKRKLSTTPYNAQRAHQQFPFIDTTFVPRTRADRQEYEGSFLDESDVSTTVPVPVVDKSHPFSLTIRLPAPPSQSTNTKLIADNEMNAPQSTPQSSHPAHASTPAPSLRTRSSSPRLTVAEAGSSSTEIHPQTSEMSKVESREPSLKIRIPGRSAKDTAADATQPSLAGIELASNEIEPKDVKATKTKEVVEEVKVGVDEKEESEEESKREFCPEERRQQVVDLIERHLCAHPLIPGYSKPDADAIYDWAVRQIYTFCVDHDLPELWAYLWENWYRRGRWELWARSVHRTISRLKTTMIMESQ